MFSWFLRGLLVAGGLCVVGAGSGMAGQAGKPPTKQQKVLTPEMKRDIAAYRALKPARGLAFHCCSCAVPCPCMFNGKDVEGCNIVLVYHIDEAGYLGKALQGQTAILVPHPTDLQEKEGALRRAGKPVTNVLYVPRGLTAQQSQALIGFLSEHSDAIGLQTLVRRDTPIAFRKLANGYEAEIPHVFHARMQALQGAKKQSVVVDNLDLAEGTRWTIGRSVVNDYQDAEEQAWHWDMANGNGSWTAFSWRPTSEYE